MPTWDGPAVLKALKLEMGLNDANEYDDTTDLYPRASHAQVKLVERIATVFPNALYPAPFAMTRAGDGKTYSYGTDSSGNAIVSLGSVQIAPTLAAFSGDTFVGWQEGRDFYDEGDHIRIVSNRTYSGTLYVRAVLTPPDITAAVAPVVNPASARALIGVLGAWLFALEGNQNPQLAQAMKVKWDDRDTGFPALMLTLKSRFRGGGAGFDPGRWWFGSPDLGTGNSN